MTDCRQPGGPFPECRKGPRGPKGSKGPRGPKGLRGPRGPKGQKELKGQKEQKVWKRFAMPEDGRRIGRGLLAVVCCWGALLTASGQEIRSHYVSKAETDGTIYHTLPVTLFENPEAGDLTFDLTYKEHRGGRATLNFTCRMARPETVDSVRFVSGGVILSGPVGRLYLEPEKRGWKHRYTFDLDASQLCGFFDERQLPEVTLYIDGRPWLYRAKRSAWRSYAPIGYRIFEMIRINEGAE